MLQAQSGAAQRGMTSRRCNAAHSLPMSISQLVASWKTVATALRTTVLERDRGAFFLGPRLKTVDGMMQTRQSTRGETALRNSYVSLCGTMVE